MEGLRAAIKRIISSQKAIYVAGGLIANAVAGLIGIDLTAPMVLALDFAFAALFLGQWVLDLRWGSPSDGTGEFGGYEGFARFGVMLTSLLFAVVLSLAACHTQIGPGDDGWVNWSFANGFCAEYEGLGMEVVFGHCGEDELLEVEDPIGPPPP
jgi:hypothetical protein